MRYIYIYIHFTIWICVNIRCKNLRYPHIYLESFCPFAASQGLRYSRMDHKLTLDAKKGELANLENLLKGALLRAKQVFETS